MHFKLKKTFTTSLSATEATTALSKLLNSRSKFLFFSFVRCFGSISGNEFTLRTPNRDRFGIFHPKIKGSIHPENPTMINTRIVPPYLVICIYLIFLVYGLQVIFYTDKMTINGVSRVPELSERIDVALLVIAVFSILLYVNIIWPLKRLEAYLKAALKLEDRG
ncbi:hypothetical protein [Chryseolinea soli]|uniref:Uncharacterized protein n=1 Tax=Chryseolinea soli TaxID=2321403 RepID=A0A385SRL2_9BACT|nr:hypothetical protein [Chryseolinea soli]AYB31498.1 hypothetical protein D4L85_13340 [Chryseolinea soli]